MKSILVLLVFVLIVNSCSAFKGSRQMDMSPFSENAGTMFFEAAKISRPFQFKHLKPYTSIPEFQGIYKHGIPLLESLRGIVYYSNQVVAINNAKLSDKTKNNQLAKYLYNAMELALKNQKVDSLQLDKLGAREVLENIRQSSTYLDGVQAAEPIVNSVVRSTIKRIDEIQDMVPVILAGFDREIEKEYASTRRNYEQLESLQERLMQSVTRLYRARMGETAQLDTLLQEDKSISAFIPSRTNATVTQLAQAEHHLNNQLDRIDIMFDQLDDLRTAYVAKQDEIIAWRTQLDEKIMIARNAITVWAQSHRNLGAGIPVPPMIDVAGMASGLVGTAAGAVNPLK